jgi:hypothetical protein
MFHADRHYEANFQERHPHCLYLYLYIYIYGIFIFEGLNILVMCGFFAHAGECSPFLFRYYCL